VENPGSHIQDTIGVNVKGNFNFDFDFSTTPAGNAIEGKRQEVVVLRFRMFALKYLHQYFRMMVVFLGNKTTCNFDGNGAVAFDEGRYFTSNRLDTERKRGNVQQQEFGKLIFQRVDGQGG
jgi:hypothetical protein